MVEFGNLSWTEYLVFLNILYMYINDYNTITVQRIITEILMNQFLIYAA